MENNKNEIVNGTAEMLEKNNEEETQKRYRFRNKLVLAAGLGLSGYVLYKTIIKSRIDKKRRTQDEQIQILKQLLLESIVNEK